MSQTVFFTTTDNVKLCGIWHIPKKPTKKAIILAHGITVDKDEVGTFIKLANTLCENGFAVFRFDFRGHGESEGKTIDATITGEIKDVTAAVYLAKNRGYTEIGLLGASFGGGIAALYAAKNESKLSCLCLWNPVINYDHCFLNPISEWLQRKGDQIKKDIDTQGWTLLGSRKIKYGKALFEEMAHTLPYEEIKKITIPTTIIHGDADSHVPYSDSKDYISNITGPHELITIHGAEHGFRSNQQDEKTVIKSSLQFFIKNLHHTLK